MELKGKKIAFLGDSITEGCGCSAVEKTYWSLIGQRTGAKVYGYGISGTRLAIQAVPDDFNRYFATRVDSMIPDADAVVVFGGTNDFGHGDAPMGTMADRTPETFYGACHDLIIKLINRYPAAQLLFATPLHRLSEDECVFNEWGIRRVGRLFDYVQAIKEVAQYYGVPVVDLYSTCLIQPKVEILRQMYMPDGLHPNDAGHARIAQRVLSALQEL